MVKQKAMIEQKAVSNYLPLGNHYYKEITILLRHDSLQVIQERERELYHALLEDPDDFKHDFKPGIERYTSGGVVIR